MRPQDRYHPLHWFAAKAVYWAIFGPLVAVCILPILFSMLIGWLEWKALPWIGRALHPVGDHWEQLAVEAGNLVLGFKPGEPE